MNVAGTELGCQTIAVSIELTPNATYLTTKEASRVEQDLWGKGRYLRAWDMWKQKAMGK